MKVNVSNEFLLFFLWAICSRLSTENVPCQLFYHVSMESVGSPKSFASLCLGEPCGSVHNEVAIQFLDLLRRYLIYTQLRVGKIIQTSSITGIHELIHAKKTYSS